MPVKGIYNVLNEYIEMYGDSYEDEFEVCGNENLEKLTFDESDINERKRFSLQGLRIHPCEQGKLN